MCAVSCQDVSQDIKTEHQDELERVEAVWMSFLMSGEEKTTINNTQMENTNRKVLM
jgi:hypothetical protein